MAFIPANDVCQVELFQVLHGQRIENTTYWRLVGGFGATQMTDLWNQMLIWWSTDFNFGLSQDLSLVGGKLTDLSSDSAPAIEYVAPTPNPTGNDPNPALPGNAALCVSFRTVGRGRSSRGRNYVAGLSEPHVTGNTVDAATVTGIQSAYNDLITLPTTAAWEWGVLSRFHNNLPRAAGVFQVITSALVVDPYVDSQRRRLTGRGL